MTKADKRRGTRGKTKATSSTSYRFEVPMPPCFTTPALAIDDDEKNVIAQIAHAFLSGRRVPRRVWRTILELDPETINPMRPRFRLRANSLRDLDPVTLRFVTRVTSQSAIDCPNEMERGDRQKQFSCDLVHGEDQRRPVIVAEGDSWFGYPFLLDDIVEQLRPDYLVWTGAAAGDTLDNMAFGRIEEKGQEFLGLLRTYGVKSRVKAFLFSGAGNDIVGTDAQDQPMLMHYVKPYDSGSTAADLVDYDELGLAIVRLAQGYSHVISSIRSDGWNIPILLHGYDHVRPFPDSPNDHRSPTWYAANKWLGSAFDQLGYPTTKYKLKRDICKILVNRLYKLLNDMTLEDPDRNTHVIDCRKSARNLGDWYDEIHLNNDGFAVAAHRFRAKLKDLGVG